MLWGWQRKPRQQPAAKRWSIPAIVDLSVVVYDVDRSYESVADRPHGVTARFQSVSTRLVKGDYIQPQPHVSYPAGLGRLLRVGHGRVVFKSAAIVEGTFVAIVEPATFDISPFYGSKFGISVYGVGWHC